MQIKTFSFMLTHLLCPNDFFLPQILLFPEINVFFLMRIGGLYPAGGKGRDQGLLFPGACFVFHMEQGHGGRMWPQCGYSPSLHFLTAPSVSKIAALQKQATAFSMCQGELNLKTSHFLGSNSVLSTSLSTLSLWGYRAEGFAEAEIPLRPQKVSETSSHVRIRRGV